MKKVLLVAAILFAGNANAAEITSRITDSVSLKVNPKIVISEPTSATYTVSGSNITASTLGGVGGAGSYSVKNDGQAFTFSETNSAVGVVTTTQDFGVAGTLAGELKANTVSTVTAGGANTEATAQRSIELSVFK